MNPFIPSPKNSRLSRRNFGFSRPLDSCFFQEFWCFKIPKTRPGSGCIRGSLSAQPTPADPVGFPIFPPMEKGWDERPLKVTSKPNRAVIPYWSHVGMRRETFPNPLPPPGTIPSTPNSQIACFRRKLGIFHGAEQSLQLGGNPTFYPKNFPD